MGGCGLGDLMFLLQLTSVQWDDWDGNLGTFLCEWISYKLRYSGSYRGYGKRVHLRRLALILTLSIVNCMVSSMELMWQWNLSTS